LPGLLKNFEIIHRTGRGGYESVVQEAGRAGIKVGHGGYHPYPFLRQEISHAYAATDLVISRAGANALTEIAANAKPAIIIPIKTSANNHQELNAYAFSEAGAAVVLNQDNLGENILLEKIDEIMGSNELQFELSERIKKFYQPDAAEKIAKEIIKLAS
jgi:UDP-N-acetylglucosamine--N-acetylmuramyl-(pentapeptide) pyrophosphoryl-undecaprenol N-acetylglucosamine transferase